MKDKFAVKWLEEGSVVVWRKVDQSFYNKIVKKSDDNNTEKSTTNDKSKPKTNYPEETEKLTKRFEMMILKTKA
jgi:hypothetical protein